MCTRLFILHHGLLLLKKKSSAQSYKSRVEELEKDLHDAMMDKFESHSPHNNFFAFSSLFQAVSE
jgi:hypothetical protein